MPENTETTRYLIDFEDKSKKIVTVPSAWKVTFGPCVPGLNQSNKSVYGPKKIPMAIRFYESKDKQKAIFTDVVSFRDLSIPIDEMPAPETETENRRRVGVDQGPLTLPPEHVFHYSRSI